MTIKSFNVLFSAIVIFSSSTIAAFATPVTLSMHDGSAEISGELISFENGIYTVETMLGSVQMSASQVTCTGEDCPTLIANTDGTPQS